MVNIRNYERKRKRLSQKGSLFLFITNSLLKGAFVNKIVKKEGDASPSKAIKFSNLRHAFK